MAEHPELYRTRAGIVVEVEVPPLAYLAVDGTGDPSGGSGFADAFRALYSSD